jgi:hypothetical protein
VWRTALPPLHDKEVELISIIPYLPHLPKDNRYEVKLKIDGKPYRITKRNCRDELDAMVWLAKLRTQVSKPTRNATGNNVGANE